MATEMESALYKQSATYHLFTVLYNLWALSSWAVNEDAYKKIKKVIELLSELSSEDFAEDSEGHLIRELLPYSKPEWKV